jgi:hypothetical protein
MRRLAQIRKARFSVISVLILTASCVCAANARQQDSTSNTSSSKTAKTPVHSTTAKSETKSGTTHTASTKHSSRRKKSVKVRGQQKIDSDRAREIQEALIREHYLTGDPAGTWNQASEDAMRRYQGDHGWQTKEVPDSRALIKLGLGPSKDHLLNPESAMTTVPDAPRSDSALPTSHSAAPVSGTPAQIPAQTQTPADSNSPQ